MTRIRHLIGMACIAAICWPGSLHVAHAGEIHIVGPNPDFKCYHIDMVAGDPDNPVVEFWTFHSGADHTTSDPMRPRLVVGPSGPWQWELTKTDPLGNPMPFLGIRFYLADGGVGVGPEGALFAHPIGSGKGTDDEFITDFWLDNQGWHMEEKIPAKFEEEIPQSVVDQGHAAVIEYVWAQYQSEPIPTVSEWGLIILSLLLMTAGTIVIRRAMVNQEAALAT